ncbi:MAG TPA: hypothetical protein VF117_08015 [Gammaproteobacteria bacterium]
MYDFDARRQMIRLRRRATDASQQHSRNKYGFNEMMAHDLLLLTGVMRRLSVQLLASLLFQT